MALSKQDFYNDLYPALRDAAKEAMILYNRSLDFEDNVSENINTGYGAPIQINLDTGEGDRAVSLEKSSEVFGKAFAAKIVPVLVNKIDEFIKSGDVVIDPGIQIGVNVVTGTGSTETEGKGKVK